MKIEFSAGDVNFSQCKSAVRLCRDFPGGALIASPLLLLPKPISSILGLHKGAYSHPAPSLAPSTNVAPPGRESRGKPCPSRGGIQAAHPVRGSGQQGLLSSSSRLTPGPGTGVRRNTMGKRKPRWFFFHLPPNWKF